MAAGTARFVDHLLDQLEPLGRVKARRMFGGHGLYCEGQFFAIVDDDIVYFKTDAQTQAEYEARDSEPFTVEMRGKPVSMSYWRVPAEVLEDGELLIQFAGRACAVARTAPKKRAKNPLRR